MVWRTGLRFGNESSATVICTVDLLGFVTRLLEPRIVSTILSLDSSELKKRGATIEKDKEAPSKEVLERLRAYSSMQAEEQQKC